jgi:phosphatidylglycerol:prolipoprotein diacylglycerol transferase
MLPVLFTVGGVSITGYAVFVLAAFLVAMAVRKHEARRLGQVTWPGYRWVGVGALLGAVVGAKLGMVLFIPPDQLRDVLFAITEADFSGKTVLGGLAGGYLGVELAKKAVGITVSTGDAFAVAIPLGQAIGRVGCFFNGCCYGTPTSLPWATHLAGAHRHPTQLYEAMLDLGLAALLWSLRGQGYPRGHLFRRYLVGYAAIRFGLEFVRGDPGVMVGPLSAAQWMCLVVMAVFGTLLWRGERQLT